MIKQNTRIYFDENKQFSCHKFFLISSIEKRIVTFLNYLTDQEVEIANSFPSYKRKLEYIAGRLVTKFCARRFLGLEIDQLEVIWDRKGRPLLYIDDNYRPELDIAISHGGKYIFCAISSERKIGLDVEPISGKPFELREAWSVPDEWPQRIIKESSVSCRDVYFTRLWSCKETIAKYLDISLDQIFNYCRIIENANEYMVFKYSDGEITTPSLRCETIIHKNHIFSYCHNLFQYGGQH